MTGYDTLVDAYDNEDKEARILRRMHGAISDAYRDGVSEGSAFGADLMASRADLAPFEHAMIEHDASGAQTKRERAYQLGRLRGFRSAVRIKRWGRWGI